MVEDEEKRENQKGRDIMSEQKETEITEMVVRMFGGRTYYTRREEAEAVRRKWDRIYYEPGLGYYIVRPHR